MAEVILMPRLSDSMTEGVIAVWYKKVGDVGKRGELLADVDTDKATMELESYKNGTVLILGGKVDDKIPVNEVLCIIGTPGEDISKLIPQKRINQPAAKENQKQSNVIEQHSGNPIFFSYSRSDSDFALKLANDIQHSGQKIWIDKSDIKPGQHWHREIQKALKNARSILVILSRSSVDSENVLNEIYYAIDMRKNIIPIKINECEMPYGLHRLHYIDFRGNYNESLNQLLDTLSTLQ